MVPKASPRIKISLEKSREYAELLRTQRKYILHTQQLLTNNLRYLTKILKETNKTSEEIEQILSYKNEKITVPSALIRLSLPEPIQGLEEKEKILQKSTRYLSHWQTFILLYLNRNRDRNDYNQEYSKGLSITLRQAKLNALLEGTKEEHAENILILNIIIFNAGLDYFKI